MAELTEREKRIVHSMNIMNNSTLFDAPFEVRTNALKATLLSCGYTWNEDEMIDLMNAIGAESKHFESSTKRLLGKYGHLLDNVNKLSQ